MRKLSYYIFILCLVLANAGLAESPKSTLKGLTKKYKKIKTFQADFREIFEWGMTGEKTQREGKIYIAEGSLFRIDTPEQLLVGDGEAVYRYNRIRAQVIIEPMSESSEKLLPRKLLLHFAEEFDAVNMQDMAVEGQAGIRLDLKPEDENDLLISEATLWMTTEDQVVRRLKFNDLSGNTTTYFFSNISFNKTIDSGLTTFTPPEGVELFDLR